MSYLVGNSNCWFVQAKAEFKYATLTYATLTCVLQIIDSDNLMDYIVTGLNCDDYKVAAAAVRCLHSLSRSVQQLRTTFHDHAVWKPLMKVSLF